MILVVIADDVDLDERDERLLRRLAAQHEVLHCTVGDVAMTEPALADSDAACRSGRRRRSRPSSGSTTSSTTTCGRSPTSGSRADAGDARPGRRRQRPPRRRGDGRPVDRRVARTPAAVRCREPSVNGRCACCIARSRGAAAETAAARRRPALRARHVRCRLAGRRRSSPSPLGLGRSGVGAVAAPAGTDRRRGAARSSSCATRYLAPPRRPRAPADRRASSHRGRCTTS